MEKAKYLPEEIDRLIDEEISRIDAYNSRVAAEAMMRRKSESRSPLRRLLDILPKWLKPSKGAVGP